MIVKEKLNMNFLTIVNSPILGRVDLADRNRVIGVAFATVIGRRLPLPTSQVSAHQFFLDNHDTFVCDLVSFFNEKIIIDCHEVRGLAEKLFGVRFDAVFGDYTLMAQEGECYLDAFLGTNLWIDKNTRDFLNKYVKEVFELANVIASIIVEKN